MYHYDVKTCVFNKEDPNVFNIPCIIMVNQFGNALHDLGENINMIHLSIREIGVRLSKSLNHENINDKLVHQTTNGKSI